MGKRGGPPRGFVEPPHPSVYHYRKKACRCDKCRYLAKEARKQYPSYKLRMPYYPTLLPKSELDYLRRLVGYDPNKDYDKEDMEVNREWLTPSR